MNKMCVGIAIVLLSVMLLPGVRAELVIEKPSPSAGDFWTFSYKSGPLTGTETFSMTGTQTVTVNGTSYNTYAFSMAGSGTFNDGVYSGTFSMAGTYHMNTQDFARVKSYFQETLIVTSGTTSTVVSYCNYTNQPPAKDYDFPLKTGKTWSYSTTEDSVCQSIVNGVPQGTSHHVDKQSLQMNVLSATTTTVPAGTFDTLYIKDNQSTPSESWFSADVGFMVKEMNGPDYKLE